MTPEEIRAFQGTSRYVDGVLGPPRDWFGKPLRVDGDLGPRTRWALRISRLDPRRQAIVQRACSRVGERETVANRGKWPDFVLRRCGIRVPDDPSVPMPDNAWCAAHASWCMSVEGLPERKEAGAQRLMALLRRVLTVLPGDFGGHKTGPWRGHIFPIIATGPDVVACADGNFRNQVGLWLRYTSEIEVLSALPADESADVPPDLELVRVNAEGTR